eukprot:COSAG02_NODE_1210_length_13856_cov_12.266182_7_plen_105_part_00
MARAIGMVVLGVWRNGWEVLLGGSLRRLSVSVAGSLTTSGPVQCCRRREQTGHDVGRRPALLGLSIRRLSNSHHPIACRAAAWLAACAERSDSLHFADCPVLLL